MSKLPEQASTGTRALFTVEQFCDAHQISPALFYKLCKQGRGPAVTKLGSLTRISPESAAAWRRRMQRNRAR